VLRTHARGSSRLAELGRALILPLGGFAGSQPVEVQHHRRDRREQNPGAPLVRRKSADYATDLWPMSHRLRLLAANTTPAATLKLTSRRNASNCQRSEATMSDFRIKDFLDRLNALGLMLSASRLPDGTIRLNQWRAINYYENEAEIKDVWTSHIVGHDSRVQDVARYIELTQNRHFRALRA
jgi:hypothetical protein